MEDQNIITNDEVLEVVDEEDDEIVETNSKNGLKLASGALIISGLIYGGYKLFKKIKSKRKGSFDDQTKNNEEVEEDFDAEE